MTEEQLKTARELKAQGWSLRGIAAELNIALASLFRALKDDDSEPGPDASSIPIDPPSETGKDAQTPASSTLANGERPRSALLAERIAETRAQLAAIEAELAEVPQRKELILAAEDLDRSALTTLEEQSSRLAKEAELLQHRLALLQSSEEKAAAEEAQARIDAMPAQMARLEKEYATAMAAFRAAETALTNAVEKLVAIMSKADDMNEEQDFLLERYKAFAVVRSDFSSFQFEKLPNKEESATQIFASLRTYWARAERGRTEWGRKLERLWNEQRQREQRAQLS